MTIPAPTAIHLRGLRLPALVAALGMAALAAAPVGVDGPTLCPFALLTGHACPGCGLTRAMIALVHGDLATAIRYHPLGPLVAAELALALGIWAARRSGWVRPRQVPAASWLLAATGIALVAVWVLRSLLGTLPPV